MVFTFEVDPEQGLCSKQPAGYLYLAYAYYVQGKYPQAAIAMRQAFNRMQGLTDQSKEIIAFFERWPTKDPNALALMTQLGLYVAEQQQSDEADMAEAVAREVDLEKVMDRYVEYCKKEKEIDPQLRLTPQKKEAFHFLARRSLSWVNKRLGTTLFLPQWAEVF